MTSVFISVLNMSITASLIAFLVMLARVPLKKAPKILSYILWLPVWLRLLLPVSFRSSFSFFNFLKRSVQTPTGTIAYIPQSIGSMEKPVVNAGISGINHTVSTSLPSAAPAAGVNPMQILVQTAAVIWVVGIVFLLVYSIISYLKTANKVQTATRVQDGIFETDRIATPFVFGFLKPLVYIPVGLSGSELPYILAHERTHIKRMDYLMKPLAFLVLVIHWFNPVMWLSFILMSRDMEMSCDDKVLREMGGDAKRNYANSLLSFSQRRSGLFMGSPLAFGESSTKSRIKNVLSFKKPTRWVTTMILIGLAALMAACTVNPKNTPSPEKNVYLGYDIQTLIANKTPYVGNNSKVVHLIDAMPLPDGIVRDTVELQTSAKPYGINVNVKMNDDAAVTNQGGISGDAFFRNSILLLSLIDNVDNIQYKIFDNTGKHDGAAYSFTYTREMSEKLMGKDVREDAQSADTLKSLVEKVSDLKFGPSQGNKPDQNAESNQSTQQMVYENNEFGFRFALPQSWKGYSIVTEQWKGNALEAAPADPNQITGPMLSIRHPLWTSENPRQDIPIMIFTQEQWQALQQDKFHIGAAPINPSELGHNSRYVFALPARYNFAFPTGFEEVEEILKGQPLKAF